MVLRTGSRLGPYEVIAQIGVGGMGEVYKATDQNLKRAVAIKVLPASVAGDAERLARFQREAEVLAALNHPHIAHIHGLEKSDGTIALVMELVEGPTLADRIAQGPIPIDEALAIATQIARALEAAHEQGIIHRDLKPANIKVRADGTVKVLDFGLAKAVEPAAAASSSVSMPPTITSPAMTQAGFILGTAGYMAPEQARGRTVDKRADIWAFGCVLFEMLSSRRAFEDEDVSMTLSKVLQREPEFDALPSNVPGHVRQAIRLCLRKDPAQRAHDIGDVRLMLEGAFELPGGSAPPTLAATSATWTRTLLVALAASLVTGVVTAVIVRGLTPAQSYPVTRFEYSVPADQPLRGTGRPIIAVSRDGRRVVYNTVHGLYLRQMDDLDVHVIVGTEETLTNPFFSPDGEWVGYFQGGQLKRIAVRGGVPIVICAAENPDGASWEADDTILFGQSKGIMRVAVAAGTPQLAIAAKPGEQLGSPHLMPDGDSVLFSATSAGGATRWDGGQVVVQSLPAGERTVVIQGGSDARYLPSGHLVYALKEALFAVPFDAATHKVTGAAVPVTQPVFRANGGSTATANYVVTDGGTLVYLKSVSATTQGALTWVGRDGRTTPLSPQTLDQPRNPRLSPDGRRVAVIVAGDLWVYDVSGRPPIRLTTDATGFYTPLWTPDGQRIVYEGGGNNATLLALPADGSNATPQRVSIEGHFHPYAFSKDGSEIVAVVLAASTSSTDIVRWPLAKLDDVKTVVGTSAREGFEGMALSPDGRWLAYTSNQTGQQEVWVRAFPGPGATARISPAGGVEPLWARSGRELYYREGDKMMAVAVNESGAFNFSAPTRLFDFKYLVGTQPPSYDVAADGRFLVLEPVTRGVEAPRPAIVVVQNWAREVARLVSPK